MSFIHHPEIAAVSQPFSRSSLGFRWLLPVFVGLLVLACAGEPATRAADEPKKGKAAKIAALKAAADKAAAMKAPAAVPPAKGDGKGKGEKGRPNMRESAELIRSTPQRSVKVAPVDPATASQVKAAAAKIDVLVEKNYAKHGVTPNATLSDELFVRRVYLDIAGTIPTLEQTRAALAVRSDSEWRARLIDRLLNSENHAGHMYNYWADILRLRDERMLKAVTPAPYNQWVRESIETNKPYDKFVYEMLTATGKGLENPATGYILRDANMPLDALNNTVRVFLGTQIGCAQCHDHPFDRWTQKEFYQMAAYTYATTYQPQSRAAKADVGKTLKALKDLDADFRPARYRPIIQGNAIAVSDGTAKLKYPEGIDGKEVKAGETVVPAAIFDTPQLHPSSGEPLRLSFARWLTSPENPALRQDDRQPDVEACVRSRTDRTGRRYERRNGRRKSRTAGVPDQASGREQIRSQADPTHRLQHEDLSTRSDAHRNQPDRIPFRRSGVAADDGRASLGFVRHAGRVRRSGQIPQAGRQGRNGSAVGLALVHAAAGDRRPPAEVSGLRQ
ncbi:MAG: DUF1549 domain-containing protein [Pirellulales bacterium]